MAQELKYADRVRETSTTTGTGTMNLDGAPSSFVTFVAGVGNGAKVSYSIENRGVNEYETGEGTVTSGSPDTLARDRVHESSNAGGLVNFSAGTKQVRLTIISARFRRTENQYWQDPVEDKDLATPPVSPSTGDRYIVGPAAVGDWSGRENEIAEWNGTAWEFTVPKEGMLCWVKDENLSYGNDGSTWSTTGGNDNLGNHTATQIIDAATFGIQFSGANQDIIGSAAGIVYDTPAADIHDFHIAAASEYSMNATELILRNGNRLQLEDGDGSNHVNIVAPSAVTANYSVTMPSAGPSGANEILESDASGNLSWIATPAGGGGGAFSDAADPVLLNTTTKDVVIGATQINTAKLSVDGDADQTQFSIQAHSTQTGNIMDIENSAGTILAAFDKNGTLRGSYGPGGVTSNFVAGDGAGATITTGSSNTLVGKDADVTVGNQIMNTVVGKGSRVHGHRNTIVGEGILMAADNDITAVGQGINPDGVSTVLLGGGITQGVNNHYSIVLGDGGASTAANQLVVGSSGAPVNDGYFGKGVTNATPTTFTFHATGGSGTNTSGADIGIQGGNGAATNSNGGDVLIDGGALAGTGTNGDVIIGNTNSGNVKIGGTAAHATTAGANILSIFNGTAPVGTLTNGASLYVSGGEMSAIDSAGNVTPVSPHDENGEWFFESRNAVTGKKFKVRMEELMRRLAKLFPNELAELIEDIKPRE